MISTQETIITFHRDPSFDSNSTDINCLYACKQHGNKYYDRTSIPSHCDYLHDL
jgi:hypothetical protein